MNNINYPNTKIEFAAKIFSPIFDFLEKYNINGGFIITILLGLYVYFSIYNNKPKKQKLDLQEKIIVYVWIFSIITNVIFQILMIIRS